MAIDDVGPGRATLRMTVREDMVNGHDIGHGGLTFTLADSAFAFACNSYNRRTVAAGAEIRFRAPTRLGDVLVADARGALAGRPRRRVRRDRDRGRDGGRDVRRPLEGDRRRVLGGWLRADDGPARSRASTRARARGRSSSNGCATTLRRAYDHVPHYRRAFDRRRGDARRPADAGRPGPLPVHRQGRPARELPVRDVRGAARAGGAGARLAAARPGKPTVVGYTREDIDTWAEVMARSIRAAGGRPGDIVHVAYGYGLFTGGLGAHYGAERLGCTVVPVSGGMTERQVQLILDFEPRIIMVTPSYFLAILDEMEAPGRRPAAAPASRSASSAPSRGPTRCGAAVEERCGHPRRRHLRAVRGDGPGRQPGGGRDPGRAARLGGPLPARDHRPGHASRCCPTARRASWSSPR